MTRKEIDETKIKVEDKELQVTVDALKPNSVGLKLGIRKSKLFIENDKGVEAYWDKHILRESFERYRTRLCLGRT